MDEADRMVNLGFEVDLTFILDKLPSDAMDGEDQGEQMDVDGETMIKRGRTRVTTLFSATMPPPVERLAKKYLKRPAIITIGEAGRAVDTVEQKVEFVTGDEKKKYASRVLWPLSIAYFVHRQRLLEILNSNVYPSPIIVFVNQKKTADMVAKDLQRAGVRRLSSFPSDRRLIITLCSGMPPRFTLGKIRNSERRHYKHFVQATPIFWSPPILLDVVLMSKTCSTLR